MVFATDHIGHLANVTGVVLRREKYHPLAIFLIKRRLLLAQRFENFFCFSLRSFISPFLFAMGSANGGALLNSVFL